MNIQGVQFSIDKLYQYILWEVIEKSSYINIGNFKEE